MTKIEVKKAIMPTQFLTFVGWISLQFGNYQASEKSTLNLFLLIINIVFAVILLLAGLENPTMTSFLKEMGIIMLDYKMNPTIKIQKIQAIWQQLAFLWIAAAEEVAEKEKKSSPALDDIEKKLQ